ncbi:MAG TPA: hypothetical protein VFA48_12015, partial [Gammaproteobacteria bacterium]|nr:hypothetical protein [Gammaproteobacteria bacterium]
LSENERSWGIYFHDMPQAATLSSIWLDLPTHLHGYDDFLKHAQAGQFAKLRVCFSLLAVAVRLPEQVAGKAPSPCANQANVRQDCPRQ